MSLKVQLARGVFQENPLAVLLLGLCPAAAVSARVIDALWMSLGVTAVGVLSTLCAWLISARAREGPGPTGSAGGALIGALLVSSFLTASFESVLLAFVPAEAASLGIYAPLISVNCLVIAQMQGARRQLFALRALWDSVGKYLGFSAGLLAISLVREGLGAGTLTLFPVGAFSGIVAIPGLVRDPPRALGLAGGGLLCLGYLAALVRLRRLARGHADAAGDRGTSAGDGVEYRTGYGGGDTAGLGPERGARLP